MHSTERQAPHQGGLDALRPGDTIEQLDQIRLISPPDGDGFVAELIAGDVTLRIPAAALDSYGATRRELLRRFGVRLVLVEVETERVAAFARRAWADAVEFAIARGRRLGR